MYINQINIAYVIDVDSFKLRRPGVGYSRELEYETCEITSSTSIDSFPLTTIAVESLLVRMSIPDSIESADG